jgi:hypothetical protein
MTTNFNTSVPTQDIKFTVNTTYGESPISFSGEIRFVRNPKSKRFGLVRISAETFFEPLGSVECMTLEQALELVNSCGGVLDADP